MLLCACLLVIKVCKDHTEYLSVYWSLPASSHRQIPTLCDLRLSDVLRITNMHAMEKSTL